MNTGGIDGNSPEIFRYLAQQQSRLIPIQTLDDPLISHGSKKQSIVPLYFLVVVDVVPPADVSPAWAAKLITCICTFIRGDNDKTNY